MGQKLYRDVLINDDSHRDSNSSEKSKPQKSCISALWWDLRSRLTIVILTTLILGLVFPIACLRIIYSLLIPPYYTCTISTNDRVPCILAGLNATREGCEAVGCCWDTGPPGCYHTRPSRYDYTVSGMTTFTNRTVLNMAPRTQKTYAEMTPFGKDMLGISLTLDDVTDTYVRIRATSKQDNIHRVESPWPDLSPSASNNPLYKIEHSSPGDSFVLKIFRHSNMDTAILTMKAGPLVMTDNYLEFTLRTPTSNIYGLGQGSHTTLRRNMTWKSEQMFARSGLNSGSANGTLAYGIHPIYICIEDDGNVHGVVLGLSQPTDVSLQPKPSITFRTSGCLIDIHLFMGPTPKDVIRQMSELIGKPALPPAWALGYHTCRSYGNVSVAHKVATDLIDLGIPHESDCGDARLMRTLGHSESALQQLGDIYAVLKNCGLKLVLHQGPQVLNRTQLSKADVFVEDPSASNLPYYGRVQGNDVVYPDFSSDNFGPWLAEAFQELQDDLSTYGIEVNGFFLVDNTPLDMVDKAAKPCGSNDKFQLTPIVKSFKDFYEEADDTICLNAIQANGTSPHYVHHNMYGHTHLKSVHRVLNNGTWAMSNVSTPILASLATFSGSGQYGGHWGGEYQTNWDTMKNSLIHLMEFNLYGIPLVGVPICGFLGELTPHGSTVSDFDPGLCWRWMQLGSLYPLAFTYYGPQESPREPNYFPKDFQSMAIDALQLRYSLFPYLYTQLYYAHIDGHPVMRPLFYEFPKDKMSLDVDEQFLLGSALMVAPTLRPFPNQVNAYFPEGCWYEFQTHLRFCFKDSGGRPSMLPSIHLPNIYIRGGFAIFQQLPAGQTLDITRNSSYTVTVALDDNAKASGSIIIGDSSTAGIAFVHVDVANHTFRASCSKDCEQSLARVSTLVDTLFVLGVLQKPEVVTINDVNIPSSCMIYDENVHSMKLSGIIFDLMANLTIITWH